VSKAYLDTTILTDILLKHGEKSKAASDAVGRYTETVLPVYAIKEFKAGPLSNFCWMHNKLVQTGSFSKALGFLQRMSTTPKRNLTSTAIEALTSAASTIGGKSISSLSATYGPDVTLESLQCDQYRLAIKMEIVKAWAQRRQVTDEVSDPLPCYKENPPYEENGLMVAKPIKCNPDTECCMAKALKEDTKSLRKLKGGVDRKLKAENAKRWAVLQQLIKRPHLPMTEDMCRNLGDAVFAFFAPNDATILTTNIRDHGPLSEALGKKAELP
jgi:hypothetical protein